MKYDVGIIGGGVIGLACAWRLAQRGACVALFERGRLGHQASWAAAGMLAAQCESAHHPPAASQAAGAATSAMFDLCLHSRALYPQLAAELLELTGCDIELSLNACPRRDWREPGILYVGTRGDDLPLEAFVAQRQQGHPVEDTVYQARPGSGESVPAVWLPREGQVENRRLVAALAAVLQRTGTAVYEGEPVTRLRLKRSRVTGFTTEQREITCDRVLLCAGAWSGQIEGLPLDCVPPMRPVAGQMAAVRPGQRIPSIIYGPDVYIVPRRSGRVLVGATMEQTGFHKSVTVGGIAGLLRNACDLVPGLREAKLETQWAGLRPGTPDSLPILGATALESLFVATGHFRNGILLAPATAQMMAGCLLDGTAIPPAFSLARFGSAA